MHMSAPSDLEPTGWPQAGQMGDGCSTSQTAISGTPQVKLFIWDATDSELGDGGMGSTLTMRWGEIPTPSQHGPGRLGPTLPPCRCCCLHAEPGGDPEAHKENDVCYEKWPHGDGGGWGR